MMKPAKTASPNSFDPLYAIFEEHLFSFQDSDSDRRTFILGVVKEYLNYLRKNNISVPKSLEGPVIDELGNMVNKMLVKKIYGCLTIQEFQEKSKPRDRKRATTNYRRTNKSSRASTAKSGG